MNAHASQSLMFLTELPAILSLGRLTTFAIENYKY